MPSNHFIAKFFSDLKLNHAQLKYTMIFFTRIIHSNSFYLNGAREGEEWDAHRTLHRRGEAFGRALFIGEYHKKSQNEIRIQDANIYVTNEYEQESRVFTDDRFSCPILYSDRCVEYISEMC